MSENETKNIHPKYKFFQAFSFFLFYGTSKSLFLFTNILNENLYFLYDGKLMFFERKNPLTIRRVKFSDASTHNSPEIQASIPSFRSKSEKNFSREYFSGRTVTFAFRHNRDGRKCLKSATLFD